MTCHSWPCPTRRPSATTVASLSKHMLVVHGASSPSKILLDRYLAKFLARWRISFAICYITFKTRFSFKEPMQSGAHLLAPGPAGVKGGFEGEFMLLLELISVGNEDTFPASTVT